MSGPLVKICGVRTPEIALVARQAGADFIGLIFAPSKRRIDEAQAALVTRAVRDGDGQPLAVVGVFVNERPATMMAIAERVGLDLIQLSGDEPPETLPALDRPVIKALRLPAGTGYDEAARLAERYLAGPVPAWALLLDTHVPGSYGGSGEVGDWELAARLAERYPIILAGGLSPENVAAAARQVGPLAVDASSGVETGGAKDPDKVRRFLAAAKAVPAAGRPAPTPSVAAMRIRAGWKT